MRIVFIVLLLPVFTILHGCKKKDNDPGIVKGTLNLEVHATHHSWDVPGLNVYLKKNAVTFPGSNPSDYEYSTITDGYGKCTFSELYPGNYYIYATGFDSTWGSMVYGEMPVTLGSSSTNDFSVNIIVSE